MECDNCHELYEVSKYNTMCGWMVEIENDNPPDNLNIPQQKLRRTTRGRIVKRNQFS
jgi:hypothetical protein